MVLDDLGVSELRENERRDLLEIIEDRIFRPFESDVSDALHYGKNSGPDFANPSILRVLSERGS
ncbi:MAG: hypothetical protein C5B49_05115 [Bdellovibrio sp.]|nr:MAG: hypothetical protein C5B49_05115 [Bdellovibrio sp.]